MVRSKLTDTEESTVVRKANPAIAIRPTTGKLTIISRRIYNLLLYHAQEQGISCEEYSLPLAHVVSQISSSENNASIKTRLREMASTTIEWNSNPTGREEDQEWNIAGLLAAKITPARAGKPITLTWSYAPGVRRELIEPKQYTRLLLQISTQLSLYSAAVLLEIGFQYLTSPGQLTMRESVDWWAAVLKGQPLKKPVDYRFFKRDTLQPGLREVNQVQSEFALEMLEHRVGRKVVELQFRVLRKAEKALTGEDGVSGHEATEPAAPPRPVNLALLASLMALGLREVDADALLSTEDPERIQKAIQYTQARQGKVDSPAAYLRTAIKHGYADVPPEQEKSAPAVDPVAITEVTTAARMVADQMTQEVLRREYERSLITAARQEYATFADDEQTQLRSQFGKTLTTLRDQQSWERVGIASPPLSARFFGWIARQSAHWVIDDGQLRQWDDQREGVELSLKSNISTVNKEISL
jgi:Initiator Replication protein